jgi:hypothetical protein
LDLLRAIKMMSLNVNAAKRTERGNEANPLFSVASKKSDLEVGHRRAREALLSSRRDGGE